MVETLRIKELVLEKNQEAAEENRSLLEKNDVLCLNLISSPGSGKTSLLECMGKHWGPRLGVIVGDVQTTLDAERIQGTGAVSLQIETGGSCHLSAEMVQHALSKMDLSPLEVLVIENVGNLVCPATYDLGESLKVAMLSVTEGAEKPVKYPALFVRAHAVIIGKTDLLPHVDFDMERVKADCRKLKNDVQVFALSSKSGEGMQSWQSYLEGHRASGRS